MHQLNQNEEEDQTMLFSHNHILPKSSIRQQQQWRNNDDDEAEEELLPAYFAFPGAFNNSSPINGFNWSVLGSQNYQGSYLNPPTFNHPNASEYFGSKNTFHNKNAIHAQPSSSQQQHFYHHHQISPQSVRGNNYEDGVIHSTMLKRTTPNTVGKQQLFYDKNIQGTSALRTISQQTMNVRKNWLMDGTLPSNYSKFDDIVEYGNNIPGQRKIMANTVFM